MKFRESLWPSLPPRYGLFVLLLSFLLTNSLTMQLKVALNEMASAHGEVSFRVSAYTLVYLEMLGLMKKCDTSPIHAEKTRDL